MKNILYLLFFSLAFFACKENYVDKEATEEIQKTNIPSVKISNVSLTSEPIPIDASGIIGSKAEINLSFKIGGIIEKLYAKETQKVRRGQLLATIRTTEIDAQVMKASQAVQKSKRDYVRIKKMYADTVATLENMEDLMTRFNVATSDYKIARFNQKYAKIRAPISGRILKRFAENNELINPGAPVFRIASNQRRGFVLNIGVADIDVVRIKIGDKSEIHFDVYPDAVFSAFVTEISETTDPMTGVFSIELTVNPQKGKMLKNGFIGKVKLFPSNQKAYYKIPMNALVEGYKNRANIYTVEEGIAKKISVKPGYIGSDFFTVSEKQLVNVIPVITDGAAYLKDGMEVRVVQ